MPIRTSTARWEGKLKDGRGVFRTGKGGYDGNYSFASRFEEGEGANLEELIGAAHAGCYSMAFSGRLEAAGYPPTNIDTTANVHLDRTDAGMTVTRIDLITHADVPGIDEETFQREAEETKLTCPISRLLTPGTEITLQATLM